MTAPLKVYGISISLGGNATGAVRAIAAAPSMAAAAKAMDCTIGHFRKYGGQTWNAAEIETAAAEPGTVFFRRETGLYDPTFTRWEPPT